MTVELTPMPVGQPGPHVQILLTNIDAWRVTVWRTVASGRRFAVRGGVEARMFGGNLGSLYLTDWEAPIGNEMLYEVEYFNAEGDSLGLRDWATTTVAANRATWGTIHDPYDPAGMVWVQWAEGAFADLERPIPISEKRGLNRSAPYVLSGVREGLVGLDAACITATRETREKLDNILGRYDRPAPPVVCIRTGPEVPLPGGLLYASVVENVRNHPLVQNGDREFSMWQLRLNEAQPPTPALVRGFPTYEGIDSNAFSYAGLDSTTETYLDLERRLTPLPNSGVSYGSRPPVPPLTGVPRPIDPVRPSPLQSKPLNPPVLKPI